MNSIKSIFLTLALSIIHLNACFGQDDDNLSRFIEVTGSAEKYIEPDEIRFHIGMKEYWKEEFEKGKEYKDYVTKIPLETIEKEVMAQLQKIGITKDQIVVKKVGNIWSRSGKAFKKSKLLELVITDFKLIDEITSQVEAKGISSLRIAELKHRDIIRFRRDVKIEAVKAAKEKAAYLLESVNEELGQLLSVIELDSNTGFLWQPQNSLSNTMLPSSETDNTKNVRKIKLKYSVKTRFAID